MALFSRPVDARHEDTAAVSNLSDHLLTFISNALDIKFTRSQKLVAVSIGSNLVSFVSSLSLAFSSSSEPILRWTTVATTLTSLVLQILSLVDDKYKLSLNVDVLSAIKDKVLDYFVDNNGDFKINAQYTMEYLLKYAVGIISFVLALVMRASGLNIFQMSAFLRVQQGLKSTASDIKEVILEGLQALDLYTDSTNASFTQQVESLLARAKDSLTCSTAELLLNTAKYAQLAATLNDIVSFQNKKLSEEQNKIYAHSKNLLNSLYLKLLDKQRAALEVSDQEDRVVCTGFVIEGEAGIGKSTLAKHLLKQVAKRMGWSPNIYDISRGDNGQYNQIYLQQDLGIGNEFGGTREDGMVQQINSIISGDPCNLEAAHVDFKHQRCNLKLVALTSNRTSYDFTRSIREEMNVAMLTRLIRISIEDPDFQGRGEPNTHRVDGVFNHLKCKIFVPDNKRPKNMTDVGHGVFQDISLHELIDYLVWRCARESLSWVNRIISGSDTLSGDVKDSLQERQSQFQNLVDQTSYAIPNAGQRFFSIRWQGQPQTGKTTQLEEIAGFISNNFKLPTAIWDSLAALEKPHIEPTVFILDDFDIKTNEKAILKAVNLAPKNSIFLVSTHHEAAYRRESIYRPLFWMALFSVFMSDLVICNFRHMFKNLKAAWDSRRYYYDYTTNPELRYSEAGLYRRLGAGGLIKTPQGFTDNGFTDTIIVTRTKTSYRINCGDSRDIKEVIGSAYTSFVKGSGVLVFKHNTQPPTIIPDMTVCIKDEAQFLRAYANARDIASMVNRTNNPYGYVLISDEVIKRIIESSSINTWIQPREYDNACDLIHGLAYTVNMLSTSLTCRATTPGWCFTLVDGVLYCESTVDRDHITVHENTILYNGVPVPTNFVKFVVHGQQALDSIHPFTIMEAIQIRTYIEQHMYDEALCLYRSSHECEMLARKKLLFFKKHPFITWCTSSQGGKVFLAIGGGLMALVGVILTTKKLYNLFSSVNANINGMHFPSGTSSSDRANSKMRRLARLEKVKHQPSVNERIGWIKANYNAVDEPCDTHYLDMIAQAIHEGRMDDAKFLYEEFIDGANLTFNNLVKLLRARPNAVSQYHELASSPSVLQPIVRKTRQALVTVHSRMACYGLLIGGNKVLTVNHAIDPSNITVAISEGTEQLRYSARAEVCNMIKDLAILTITDKTFKARPSLGKFFPDKSTKTDWNKKCFFIRPLDHTFIIAGFGNYITSGRTPGRDSDADIYAPTDYIKFDFITQLDVSQVYRPGDCGMPLVAISDNKCYIVGIHNAYNTSGTAWFSPLFREELMDNDISLAQINATDMVPLSIVKPLQELDMVSVPDYNSWIEKSTGNPWSSHSEIPVIGFCKPLHYYSKPKTHKVKLRSPNCKLDTHLCPTPTQLCQLTQEAIDFLPKDDDGIPRPLLAQTKKMFNRIPFTANPEYLQIAVEIVKDEFSVNYGRTTPLRMHEVVNGKMDGLVKRLNLATSCGPYLKKKYGLTDKRQLFEDVNRNDPKLPYTLVFTQHPAAFETREHYDQICSLWEQGKPTAIVIKDNPKVEFRDSTKIETTGDVRLFCELDLATNMAFKRYFGGLTNEMMLHHSTSPCKVGFNPYTLPTFLFKYIPENYSKFSSDLKRMDKQLTMDLLMAFADVAAHLCDTEEHRTAIYTAMKSLTVTIHIQEGVLYYAFGGNPSGISITTVMNTTIREIGCVYTYVKLMMERLDRPYLCSYAGYVQHIVSAKLGDDEFVASSPSIQFTFEESRQAWQELGLELVKSKNSENEDFCSRELIRSDDGILYPRLKKESILASLYWINKRDMSDIGLTFTNVLFEATLWDEDFFQDVKHDVLEQIKFLGIPASLVHIPVYARQRTHFAEYVLGRKKSPMYLISPEVAEEYLGINADLKTQYDTIPDYSRIFFLDIPPNDDTRPDITYRYSKALTAWITTVRYGTSGGTGVHARKNISKQLAFKHLIATRNDVNHVQGSLISTNNGEEPVAEC